MRTFCSSSSSSSFFSSSFYQSSIRIRVISKRAAYARMILISCVVKQQRTFLSQTVRLKRAAVIYSLLSRGGRHRLVFSVLIPRATVERRRKVSLFACSVHTEGVSSSTRLHLSLFNSMMISHVYSFVLLIKRRRE